MSGILGASSGCRTPVFFFFGADVLAPAICTLAVGLGVLGFFELDASLPLWPCMAGSPALSLGCFGSTLPLPIQATDLDALAVVGVAIPILSALVLASAVSLGPGLQLLRRFVSGLLFRAYCSRPTSWLPLSRQPQCCRCGQLSVPIVAVSGCPCRARRSWIQF